MMVAKTAIPIDRDTPINLRRKLPGTSLGEESNTPTAMAIPICNSPIWPLTSRGTIAATAKRIPLENSAVFKRVKKD